MPMPPFPARDRIANPQGLLTESWRQWLARVQDTLGALTGGASGTGLVLTGPPARGDATQLLWIAANGEVRQGTLASSDMPMISETKISNGSLLARVADNEAITGAWTFGTLPALPAQAANLVWAGPTSGGPAAPGFRALVDADVPDTLTLTAILGTGTDVAGTLRVAGNLGVHGGSLFAHAPLTVTTTDGDLTLAPAASLKLGPVGGTTLPTTPYGVALGTLQAKFRSLAVGELYTETLVAQETVATIGGRIVVCPTTALVEDLAAGATTLTVKHNNLASGDVLYMESAGTVEFLRVTSGATGAPGAWSYTVERDKDGGPGNHAWAAGDAVVNTGQAGAGFIDVYSVRGLKSHLEAGPTIVGNVRTASGTSETNPNVNAHNAWEPRWAVGHLNGLYGQTGGVYGAAFGTPGGRHALYTANEVRFKDGGTTRLKLDGGGLVLYDGGGVERVNIGASGATFTGSIVVTAISGLNYAGAATPGGAANSIVGQAATATSSDFSAITGATKPENNATVGATWGTNLSGIPATLGTPSGTGLFLASTHLGYYTGGNWTSYIKSDGTFKFYGAADKYIEWTGSALNIRGSLNASDITAGTLSADRIGASSIDAGKLNVSTLSAISANLGTITSGAITGGTITGGTVRTAASGARVEMEGTGNTLTIYDSGGQIGQLSGAGIILGPASGAYESYDNKYAYRFSVGSSDDGAIFGLYGSYYANAVKYLGLRNEWDGAASVDSGEAVTFIEAVSKTHPGGGTYTSRIQLHSGLGGHRIAYTSPEGHDFSGSLTVDTDTLVVDATNNRVGVKTSSPIDTLDVAGNIIPHTTNAYTLGASSYKWQNIHLELPAAQASSNYAVAGYDNSGDGRLGYVFPVYTGTVSVRKGDDSGALTLTFQSGILKSVA